MTLAFPFWSVCHLCIYTRRTNPLCGNVNRNKLHCPSVKSSYDSRVNPFQTHCLDRKRRRGDTSPVPSCGTTLPFQIGNSPSLSKFKRDLPIHAGLVTDEFNRSPQTLRFTFTFLNLFVQSGNAVVILLLRYYSPSQRMFGEKTVHLILLKYLEESRFVTG